MGLDLYLIKHEHCAGWSYGRFNEFRHRLAAAKGIDLDLMKGFGGAKDWPSDEPLTGFLNHSDCDGKLSAEECGKIEPALREIVMAWPEDDYDRIQGLQLADAMKDAVSQGTGIEFG